MPVSWLVPKRKPKAIGVCCHCGREITQEQVDTAEVVTVVAAEFDRLRAHRECHFYMRSGIEWPTNDR